MQTDSKAAPKAVRFYRVSLACEAAPEIACGIRSKPVLRTLERQPLVTRACLDHTGAILAVQWTFAPSGEEERFIVSLALASEDCVCVEQITSAPEQRALFARFRDGEDWYDADRLDRLSEEEASIIAARIVKRMGPRAALASVSAARLTERLAAACREVLMNDAPGTIKTREERLRSAMLSAARPHLTEQELAALETALTAGGHRPLENER